MKPCMYSATYEPGVGFWVPIKEIGAVFLIDEKKESYFIGMLSGGEKESSSDINKVVVKSGYVYFFSRVSYELWRFNRKDNSIEHIKYYNHEFDCICNVVEDDNVVWIFPNNFEQSIKPIICLNLDTLELEVVNYDYKREFEGTAITLPIYKDGLIVFAKRKKNNICVYTIECRKKSIKKINIPDAKYVNCVEFENNRYWVLYKTNDERTKIEEILHTGESRKSYDITEVVRMEDSLKISIIRMIKHNENLILVYGDTNRCVQISLFDQVVTPNVLGHEVESNEYEDMVTSDVQLCENGFYLYSPSSEGIRKYDYRDNSLNEIEAYIDDADYGKNVVKLLICKDIIYENSKFSLNSFLNAL